MTSLIESLAAGLAIVLASAVCIPKVLAEPRELKNDTETVPEAIDRAATQSSLLAEGDFFKDRSIGGDAAFTFGIGYDEDKLAKEARQLGAISKDLLNQQSSQDPTIRTQDLPNPYSSSLLSDTELRDLQAEPSGAEQPTEADPIGADETIEESTEDESNDTEGSTETEPNNTEDSTETESNNTEDSTDEESSTTETESNDTEDSTEEESNNTESESNTTEDESNDEDSTEEEPNNTEGSTETEP